MGHAQYWRNPINPNTLAWDRFRLYAKFVVDLNLDLRDGYYDSPYIRILEEKLGGVPMESESYLPKLRTLDYHGVTGRYPETLFKMLMTSSLLALAIDITDGSDNPQDGHNVDAGLSHVLSTLAAGTCKKLKTLKIWVGRKIKLDGDYAPAVSQAIAACQELEAFNLWVGSPTVHWDLQRTIRSLQTLPLLSWLSLYSFNKISSEMTLPDEDGFSSLQVLYSDYMWIVSRVNQRPNTLPLLREVKLHEKSDKEKTKVALQRLSQMAPNVVRLSITISEVFEEVPDTLHYRWENVYEPLLNLRSLESLTVSMQLYPLGFSDAEFARTAQSWPRMRSLHLKARAGCYSPRPVSELTLGGLDCLAQHCPDLRHLSICVCASPSVSLAPSTLRQHHRVRKAEVIIADPNSNMANLIKQMWPSAKVALQCPSEVTVEMRRIVKGEMRKLQRADEDELDDELEEWESFKQASDIEDESNGER